MAVCADWVDGKFTQIQSAIGDCTSYVVVTSDEYSHLFDAFTLDAETVAIAFSFGMGAIITAYLTSYPVGVIKRMLLDDD